ncbi:PREDICTED: DDT domain-containing protein DDB_G0282237 isoform X2 [Theobroma cacao]|uniref:DDT domain-containing protein DDB_G0282237 isoform X2 n=1 Tax=Theobroma cacao TaxID=3641 RepID=A0AB32X2M4_THECC|nr:PREDICTED: DDT domain-containing protein DDB_G0282237 isoform X2 [Theobroma cacao]
MEETKPSTTKPRSEASKRRPFTEVTNLIPSSLASSQSSSSSLIKPPTKSSLALDLKSPLNKPNSDINSNSKFTAVESTTNDNDSNKKGKKKKKEKEKGKKKKKEKEKGKSQSNKAKLSPMLSPLQKTPSVSGTADSVGFEPCTVYSRRHTADKRKSKGKEIAEPFSWSLEMRMPDLSEKKDGDGDIGLSKSCPLPRKRKQRMEKAEVNASKNDLHQDFIDKQRAYSAEVDAFELEE